MAYAIFTKDDGRRIARAVRRVERQAGNRGQGSRSHVTRSREVISVLNQAPLDVPEHGVVWVHSSKQTDVRYYGSENWDAGTGPYMVRRPIHAGHERIAIACASIPQGSIGSAWIAGDHPCLIYGWGGQPVGYRCFTWPNSFVAHYFVNNGHGAGIPNTGPIWCLSFIEYVHGTYIGRYRVRLGDWRP